MQGTGGDCKTACEGAGVSAMSNEVHTDESPIYFCSGYSSPHRDYRMGWNKKGGSLCYHYNGDSTTFYCLCTNTSAHELVTSPAGDQCEDTCTSSGKYPVQVSTFGIRGYTYDEEEWAPCYAVSEGKTLPGWQLYRYSSSCYVRQVDGGEGIVDNKECLCRKSNFRRSIFVWF